MRQALSREGFCIVIPVYNHGCRVRRVVLAARELGVPVLVVNDGSTDETAAELSGIEGITVLAHDRNRGKGAALRTGFAAAALLADYALTLDADGQHDPAQAGLLMAAVAPGDRPLVVGRREGMDEDKRIPWTSRFGRKFSNFWVWAAGGPRLSDTQCGMRAYPLPETMELGVKAQRFAYEVEILVLAHGAGIPVREAPISVSYQLEEGRISHFRPFADFWRNACTFTRLIALRLLPFRRARAASK